MPRAPTVARRMQPSVVSAYDPDAGDRAPIALARVAADVLTARLLVVAVRPGGGVPERFARLELRADRAAVLAGTDVVEVAAPSAAAGLHAALVRERPLLAVVGSSRAAAHGRVRLGATSARLVDGAPCAVAVAPRGWAKGARALSRIGVAVDGSERDRSAVALAGRLAERVAPRARVETIHVETAPQRGRTPRVVEAHVHLEGEPADALAAHSAELDLLILGSRGRGRLGSVVLGSVAARLIGIARCPVLALPSNASSEPALAVAGDVSAGG